MHGAKSPHCPRSSSESGMSPAPPPQQAALGSSPRAAISLTCCALRMALVNSRAARRARHTCPCYRLDPQGSGRHQTHRNPGSRQKYRSDARRDRTASERLALRIRGARIATRPIEERGPARRTDASALRIADFTGAGAGTRLARTAPAEPAATTATPVAAATRVANLDTGRAALRTAPTPGVVDRAIRHGRVAENRVGEVGVVGERGAGEVGVDQAGATEVGLGEVRAAEVAPRRLARLMLQPVQLRVCGAVSCQVTLADVRPFLGDARSRSPATLDLGPPGSRHARSFLLEAV